MIKPNELRIGNYVHYTAFDNHYLEIMQLFKDSFQGNRTTDHSFVGAYMYSSCAGIPLDESWLLRFGFSKCEPGFDNIDLPYWVKNGVCLFYNESPPENTYLIGQGFSYENLYYAARNRWIDSVHELMNIYYAMTGEELELKN